MKRRTRTKLKILVEPDLALPIVDLEFAFEVGSLRDGPTQEGLALTTARLIREGPRDLTSQAFEDQLAQFGAKLGVDVTPQATRFRVTTLERTLEPVFALVARTLQEPALRASDFQRIKREINHERIQAMDDDQLLVSGFFRAFLFEQHPYGRSVIGDRSSMRRIQLADVQRFFRKHYRTSPMIVGSAGALNSARVRALCARYITGRFDSRLSALSLPQSKMRSGRHVLIVDKPDRTQCQLYIGRLGIATRDPNFFPLLVANTAFGGSFSSRLMQAVRVERGWSYGAYSRLYHSERRDSWNMWTFPALENLRACAELQIDLMEKWVDSGLTSKEIEFAKISLINSRCFDEETAIKRLATRVDIALGSIPESYIKKYTTYVRSVSRKQANEAVRQRLNPKDLAIVIVASAKSVVAQIERIKGVKSVEVVPYDRQ